MGLFSSKSTTVQTTRQETINNLQDRRIGVTDSGLVFAPENSSVEFNLDSTAALDTVREIGSGALRGFGRALDTISDTTAATVAGIDTGFKKFIPLAVVAVIAIAAVMARK